MSAPLMGEVERFWAACDAHAITSDGHCDCGSTDDFREHVYTVLRDVVATELQKRLRAFSTTAVQGGDMTPAARRMLDRILTNYLT